MKQLRGVKHGKNTLTIECRDTISTAEVSAFISGGEVLEVEEGDWRTSEIRFEKNGEDGNYTLQEAMALLVNRWPQFYSKVKCYALKDKLWSVAKAEDFAREEEIKDLTQRIDNLTEELNALSKKRRRLQLPDPGKKARKKKGDINHV
jgi:hypothetical protein